MEEEEGEDEILVACRCESARAVATLLHCLRNVASSSFSSSGGGGSDGAARNLFMTQTRSSKRSNTSSTRGTGAHQHMSAMQPVTVFCSPTSLTFHIYGKAKQMQASVDLQKSLFSYYQVISTPDPPPQSDKEEEEETWQGSGGEFCVNLSKVLECLHVLGSASSSTLEKTKLSFTYNSATEVFCMELLEQDTGLLVTAAIPGMIPPDDDLGNSLALAFRSSPLEARMIVQSETLKEMVQELEIVSGATHGTVSLGPGGLEMTAVGHLGECVVSIPSKGRHVLSFETHAAATVTPSKPRSYPLQSLLASMRGLDIAQETCITINTAGMMAIQHQVVDPSVGDGNPNFVDFILCCMEEDDDEDGQSADKADEGDEEEAPSPQRRTRPSRRTWRNAQHAAQGRDGPVSDMQARGHRESDNDDDDDDDSSDEGDGGRSARSSLPLFGSLVNSTATSLTASSPRDDESANLHDGDGDEESPGTRWSNEHKRRRMYRTFAGSKPQERPQEANPASESTRTRRRNLHAQHGSDGGGESEDDNGFKSTDLLDNDDGEDEDGANDVGASQPLDVTEVASSPEQQGRRLPSRWGERRNRDRDDDCSSPELAYGRQDQL